MKPSHACRATQDGWVMVERSDRECFKTVGGSEVKNSPAIEGGRGDVSSILVSGRSPGRIWQPLTVFLPGKSHGQEPGGQSMESESDTT